MERMQAKLAEIGGIKKKIVKWGGRKGIRGNYNRQKGLIMSTKIRQHNCYDVIIYSKVKSYLLDGHWPIN